MKILLALALVAGPAAARDVTGAFQTVYIPDSGVKTAVAAPQPGTTIWALAQSGGVWTTYPGTLNPDGSFVIPGVPDGVYFLAIDNGSGNGPVLTKLTTSTPDASTVAARRPDTALASGFVPVSLDVTGLDPWQVGTLFTGDLFQIDGSNDDADLRPFRVNGRPPAPAPGATSFHGTINWNAGSGTQPRGLPDASKGDVTYFHSNPHSIIGSGAAALSMRQATRYSRRTDVTVTQSGPNSISVALQPAPQTGSLRADVRYSQFQKLIAQANPAARFTEFDFDLFGYPHTVQFPDQPSGAPAPVLIFFGAQFNGSVPGDTDYGTLRYGEFLDAHWVKFRQVLANFAVSFTAPGASTPSDWPGAWGEFAKPETRQAARRPIAPRIAPVVPFIEGKDGFTAQSQVSLTPTISWAQQAGSGDDECRDEEDDDSGRSGDRARGEGRREERGHSDGEEHEGCGGSGVTTSVTVVQLQADDQGNTNFATVLTASVFGDSFTVPPGYLSAGSTYFVDIGSNHGSWMHPDQPLFRGGPAEAVDTITATFTTAGTTTR